MSSLNKWQTTTCSTEMRSSNLQRSHVQETFQRHKPFQRHGIATWSKTSEMKSNSENTKTITTLLVRFTKRSVRWRRSSTLSTPTLKWINHKWAWLNNRECKLLGHRCNQKLLLNRRGGNMQRWTIKSVLSSSSANNKFFSRNRCRRTTFHLSLRKIHGETTKLIRSLQILFQTLHNPFLEASLQFLETYLFKISRSLDRTNLSKIHSVRVCSSHHAKILKFESL